MKVVLDTNTLLVSVSTRSPFYPIYKAADILILSQGGELDKED
jgi:hypothetical protein